MFSLNLARFCPNCDYVFSSAWQEKKESTIDCPHCAGKSSVSLHEILFIKEEYIKTHKPIRQKIKVVRTK